MLAFATFTQRDRSQQELTDVFVNVSGEVAELPAGPLRYALGYEYREEEGFFTPDAVVQRGDTADVPASPTAGEVTSDEVYLELRVPLLFLQISKSHSSEVAQNADFAKRGDAARRRNLVAAVAV
ncbi:MAG: hypothetical protein HC872_01125 [Gammaproteobacteria bacterium]|nr:hypothetical protein [Gammaproteobacteria bacterium]